MKNIIKFILWALALTAVVTGAAVVFKKQTERLTGPSDEDAMFIG